jgi:thiosulfate reductase/polysulfide reductase chain A
VSMSNKKEGLETKKIICWAGPGCHCQCGLLADVKDGKLVGLRGNADNPVNQGYTCGSRSSHFIEWLYHPCQLMYPLKRAGERGENKWQRISWDQALDEIADKLQQLKAEYGAECLATIGGTCRSDLYGIQARFLNLWGNPVNHTGAGTICNCNRIALKYALLGTLFTPFRAAGGGFEGVKCFVFEGSNVKEAFPLAWYKIVKWKRQVKEGKIIAIDPRATPVTKIADIWLQIRPGTDAALLMAWINVIIEEGLCDRDFVDKWTFGFNELKRRAAEYPPEKVAEITWAPAEKIREAARMYATNKPSDLTDGVATDHIGLNSIRVEQARNCLRAITGNFALNGGQPVMWPGPVQNGTYGIRDSLLQLAEKCPPEQRKKQLGADRFKLMTWPAWEIMNKYYEKLYGVPLNMSAHSFLSSQVLLWPAILEGKPYPVKAIITWAANPLVHGANTKLIYKALKSPNLELHVVMDMVMTPTAMLADYILPAASKLEKPMCHTKEDFLNYFSCGEKAVEPLGERRSDYDFLRGLAVRMGFEEYFPWETEDDLNEYRLKPLGINFHQAATEKYLVRNINAPTYEDINPKTGKPYGFATPSGKIELYSNILKELGYDPLPFYEEPPESPIRTPDVAKEYPLILNTGGRFMPQFHSEHRHIGYGMREQHPDPIMEIHPDTAKKLGINDGDWAWIETRRGVIKQKAKYNPGILPQVVNCEASWWFPEQPGQEPWLLGVFQSNANILTISDPDACDPITGGWPLRALLCKVYKVETPKRKGAGHSKLACPD